MSEPDDFMAGELAIECLDMRLVRREREGEAYSGPGSITQTAEGGLSLKLHCSERVEVGDIPEHRRASYDTGEIIPPKAFYRLEARDLNGELWTADRVLPSSTWGREGVVLHADLIQISTEREMGSDISFRPKLYLGFPGHADFPCNVDARTTRTVNGEEYYLARDLNRAKFSTCGYDFELENSEQDWFLVRAQSGEAELPLTSADLRVSEALQFTLSRRLLWSLREFVDGNIIRADIRSLQILPEAQSTSPPVTFSKIESGDSVWALFERYLDHISEYSRERKYHPLSALVSYVISASSSALENQALVNSVAVEGILDLEFPDAAAVVGDERDALLRQIESAIAKIEADAGFQENFRRRVTSWLQSSLPNPSAKTKLYHLVEEDLLEERLVKVWDNTRHRAAHGGFFSGSEYGSPNRTRKLARRARELRQLFNQLVFLAVNYDGPDAV